MGCICFENEAMGIYFITDPDGYWLEVVPTKKEDRNDIHRLYYISGPGKGI